MEKSVARKAYLTLFYPLTILTTILRKVIAGAVPSKKVIMEQDEENDRMTLTRQESIVSGVSLDGDLEVNTESSRGDQKKTKKTTYCDNLGNIPKICLAICMVCVMVLLVTVIVLALEKVCKKAPHHFHEGHDRKLLCTEGHDRKLLCTQCSPFLPSSDLTQYKDVCPVRVYNARATGSYCCVETAEQLERLIQLVPSKLNQRRIYDQRVTYNSIEKPTAHLFLNLSKSGKQGEFLPWSVLGGYGTAFVAGEVTYSVQDRKLKVPTSGHYYVYSHVTFRRKEPDVSKIPLYRHYILGSNPYLPNAGEEELISESQTKKTNGPYMLQSSSIAAILELRKDDQLRVGVSEIASVFWRAEENYFGLKKI